jgi:hypothetical protein
VLEHAAAGAGTRAAGTSIGDGIGDRTRRCARRIGLPGERDGAQRVRPGHQTAGWRSGYHRSRTSRWILRSALSDAGARFLGRGREPDTGASGGASRAARYAQDTGVGPISCGSTATRFARRNGGRFPRSPPPGRNFFEQRRGAAAGRAARRRARRDRRQLHEAASGARHPTRGEFSGASGGHGYCIRSMDLQSARALEPRRSAAGGRHTRGRLPK